MTQKQAIQEYKESAGDLKSRDRVAYRCGFVDYIDMLQKDGRITEKQAAKWPGIE